VKISCKRLDLKLVRPWAISRGLSSIHAAVVVVRLSDGGNILGLGEASPIHRYGESSDLVESVILSINEKELSFLDLDKSLSVINNHCKKSMAARCALSVALLDGAAKVRNLSVYNHLGLPFRENHHLTSYSIGIDSVNIFRDKVTSAHNYPILKIKVGVPTDFLNLRAIREVAPEKLLRLDANEAWKTKEEALENIERFSQDNLIQLIEQPMPAATPVEDWKWLKARSPMPIIADESYHRASDAERCAECFHGVNVKLVKSGGIIGAFEALQSARKAGLKTMIGCMIESSILISAAAHLAGLCDYIDLDGNLLIANDPYKGVTAENGVLSFANCKEEFGIQVSER
jgi:L-alanine-DL-glutamate epimerase-like enolase superfamily enzyme